MQPTQTIWPYSAAATQNKHESMFWFPFYEHFNVNGHFRVPLPYHHCLPTALAIPMCSAIADAMRFRYATWAKRAANQGQQDKLCRIKWYPFNVCKHGLHSFLNAFERVEEGGWWPYISSILVWLARWPSRWVMLLLLCCVKVNWENPLSQH